MEIDEFLKRSDLGEIIDDVTDAAPNNAVLVYTDTRGDVITRYIGLRAAIVGMLSLARVALVEQALDDSAED